MRLILARHGNTFAPGDKVYWVGSRNDLPLVASGLKQAQAAAAAMADISLQAIYCAPLKRTAEFARIVAEAQKDKVAVLDDDRLTELDYGQWSGLSDDEIIAAFGSEALTNWTEKSIFPQNCGWPDQQKIIAEVHDFVDYLLQNYPADANILAVSSNGRLRFFTGLIAGEFEKRQAEKSLKVGTGRLAILELGETNRLILWNGEAAALKESLSAAGSSGNK